MYFCIVRLKFNIFPDRLRGGRPRRARERRFQRHVPGRPEERPGCRALAPDLVPAEGEANFCCVPVMYTCILCRYVLQKSSVCGYICIKFFTRALKERIVLLLAEGEANFLGNR